MVDFNVFLSTTESPYIADLLGVYLGSDKVWIV